jgi:penicillin-binding protein 1C
VSLRDALVNSLNIPAVATLKRISNFSMRDFLEDIGVEHIDLFKKDLGLSVALGAYPVTLENLVEMYSSFANNGYINKILFLKNQTPFKFRKIMSREAAYLITDCLSGLMRPDIPASWEYTLTLPRIAWKTGTSFGLNDAWSIGYNPDYTVGVWVGNFNGQGSPALIGIETATPLLFLIFEEIARGSDRWFKKSGNIKKRRICAISGQKPDEFCKKTVMDSYIPGVSSEKPCEIHKQVDLDPKAGYIICDHCRNDQKAKKRVVEDYPPEYSSWLVKENVKFRKVPEHNPDCSKFFASSRLKIKSPYNKKRYFFRQDMDPENQMIKLEASTCIDTKTLFWFINRKYYSKTKPGENLLYNARPGIYSVTCTDNTGRSDEVEFTVLYR